MHQHVARIAMVATTASLLVLGACSHAPKKTPELSKLEGKKVALVDIDGEPTSRQVAEVALVNQLTSRGTFILIPKKEIEEAKTRVGVDTSKWTEVARAAGADVALRIKVLQFDANETEGYSSETIEDSQLKAETGNGKTQRLYKVKALDGKVRYQIDFAIFDSRKPAETDVRTAIAEKSDRVTADARTGAAHLPPRLGFLEKLSNDAFRAFFDRYN
jgi:hypothetical protein